VDKIIVGKSRIFHIIATSILVIISVAGCATGPKSYNEIFTAKDTLSENSKVFDKSDKIIYSDIETVLVNHGFTLETTNADSGVISAKSSIIDPNDHSISYLLTATVLVTPLDNDKTRVGIAVLEQRVRHQETHSWWHLLGIVPLFPYATQYHTVVRSSGVIRDKKFYSNFFHELSQIVDSESQQKKSPTSN